jgi:DnaJ-class molecular chaperone
MILSGKRRACPSCRGTGVNTGPDGRDHWTCTPCAGRGWQEHKSTWS